MYLKTDGDVLADENTRSEVDLLIKTLGITKDHNMLDVCCGQGRHSLEFFKRGYKKIVGIDSSIYLLGVAKQRAMESQAAISFLCIDARSFISGTQKDVIFLMGNSFGYFENRADDFAVLTSIRNSLKVGGKIALDTVDGVWMRNNFEARSWEWADRNLMVCREREITKDGERLLSREVIINTETGVVADQVYAVRLYTVYQLRVLLNDAKFGNIKIENFRETGSDRSQDLGMMGKRILVTGVAK